MSVQFICSTLASDKAFTIWSRSSPNDLPKKTRQVLIKGGTGVADKRVVTPYGVTTQVTSEEIALLKEHCPPFNRQLKRGFLKIMTKKPSSSDRKKIAKDLSEDSSAPLTPAKLKSQGKKEAIISTN